jgi:hypothetical protein
LCDAGAFRSCGAAGLLLRGLLPGLLAKELAVTDSERAAQEIYDRILVDLLQSEPEEAWLHKTPDEIKIFVRQIIDRHMC